MVLGPSSCLELSLTHCQSKKKPACLTRARIVSGIYNTNADSIRITIYGKGGHGSAPHTAIDPIVIAARTILALQTIPSRETKPGEMAVVTVGYIRAGTKNNIIPDEAELGLTVRTNKTEVRKHVLASMQ